MCKYTKQQDYRVKYNQQNYKEVFSEGRQRQEIDNSVEQPSLLDLVMVRLPVFDNLS